MNAGDTDATIGVGAYVSPTLAAAGHSNLEGVSGQIYSFSSRGPYADGCTGVTLCAPGKITELRQELFLMQCKAYEISSHHIRRGYICCSTMDTRITAPSQWYFHGFTLCMWGCCTLAVIIEGCWKKCTIKPPQESA